MIKNSHEYDLTNSMLIQFNERKNNLKKQKITEEVICEINGIDSITEDLKQQVHWYEAVKNNTIVFEKIETLGDLPKAIIGKRIQLNIMQDELAQKLGMDSDEYIRMENDDFYGLTPELLSKILLILNIDNPNHILERNYALLMPIIESNLKKLKINKKFLSSVMPIPIEQIQETFRNKSSLTSYLIEKFLESFKRIFSVSLEENTSPSHLNSALAVAFKRRININEDNLTFTTSYAAYVVGIVANQMPPSATIKADPITIREIILENYGAVTVETCLEYIWSINIAVIPFNMHRSFHGACFDFGGSKAIALSQRNQSISRWKFDMLHELYHALTMDYYAYIERTEIMDQDDEEEKTASRFASFVIFGQEMDSFLKLVLERSEGQVERIKNNVISVAREYSINIDDFSNYVAYRISKWPISFWGVAANLQTDDRNPIDIFKKYLFEHVDIKQIDPFELEILQKTLSQEVNSFG